MALLVKITNPHLYYEKVSDVDADDLIGNKGSIEIDSEEQGRIVITGEHGKRDYEEEWGFILEEPGYAVIDALTNTDHIYMDEEREFGLEEDAAIYRTEREAKKVAEELGDWAAVVESGYVINQ